MRKPSEVQSIPWELPDMQKNGDMYRLLLSNMRTEDKMGRKKITEVADVERAVAGKIYPTGCTLIALSATKPEPEYSAGGEIDSRYAVLVPKKILSEYLFEAVKWELPEFLHKHRTGINLQFSELKHLNIVVLAEKEQITWVKAIKKLNDQIVGEQKEISRLKDMKAWYLDSMFPK